MKIFIWCLALTALIQGFSHLANAEDPKTHYVVVNLTDVYVPEGFDTSSNVYVVVSGMFPNGCYFWKDVLVEDKGNKTHEIETLAEVVQEDCTMALVPFREEVELGRFEAGEHTLVFVNGDGTVIERPLVINE